MNKRIVELAEQAELSKAVYWMDQKSAKHFDHLYSLQDIHTDQVKKFAELIVQECAQVCLSQLDPANLNYKPSERFAEAVKQHFGVEQ